MDEAEIGAIYEANVDKLYRFLYYKTLNQQIAEDLTAQVFLSFCQASQAADREIDDPVKFLYGIARNTFNSFLREKYKRNELFAENVDDFMAYVDNDPERLLSVPMEGRALPFIKRLPEAQRRVAVMRLIEKQSLKEIAEALGKNMNYVKTTQRRALRSLEEMVACTPVATTTVSTADDAASDEIAIVTEEELNE